MARRRKVEQWDGVFGQVRVHSNPDHVYVPRPSDADLDDVEAEVGSGLPRSYRAFMLRFGPGDLFGEVILSQVREARKGSWTVGSRTLQLRDIYHNDPLSRHERSDWLASLVYFGSSYHGDEYAWDPNDVACSAPHECRIYRLPRRDEGNPIAAGRTFAEFVEWVVADAESWMEADSLAARGPGICYHRLHLRGKRAPLERDVKLWLEWNNHAVRDLARAIRDEQRAEAFPVLADALEEAGCTNADLLDSCRTGDPDVDGVWVLRVLLGG